MKRLFAAAVFLAFAPISFCESAPPSATAILAKLRHQHPRLLASAADFVALKKRVAAGGEAAQWFAEVRKQADATLAAPPSEYVIPDGLRLLETSRRVRDRALTLGLVFRLTGDQRYAARLWREFDAAAHFPDWNPRHFLDTAEMTAAFAIGYDWLFAEWTAEQRTALREAIVTKGLNQSLDLYRKDGGWASVEYNWNQVCNGGMTLGALAVADEQPALAGEIIRAAITSVPRAMRHFAPDGAWGEGPGYWDYATEYDALMLAALDSALGTDFGLAQIDGFAKAPDFPIQINGPLGRTFNYADAGDGGAGGSQIFWFATKFNNASHAAWRLERARKKPTPLDLLWGAAWLDRKPQLGVLPLARYFRGTEVVTMRSAWGDPRATFVGFKAGDNKVNHGHLDLGGFVLDAVGQRWAIDLGADDYNLPGYFGPQRWIYYRLRAEGNNTLVIAPDAEPDQDPRAEAKITRFSDRPGASFAIADITSAYARTATRVRRGIALRGHDVLVQDEVRTRSPADVWWFLHTGAQVLCEGASATLIQGGSALTASILSPPGATFITLPAEPLATSPHPPRQQVKPTVVPHPQKLAVHLQDVTDLRLVILLSPERPSAAARAIVPLSQWK